MAPAPKPVVEIDLEENNGCNEHIVNIVSILTVLKAQNGLENVENSISKHLNFKIF